VQQVKAAGYDDVAVIEILMHVAVNTFTNYLNNALQTDIDFPVVTPHAR
jgi:alkylhydroperoxidase family enzyme